MQIDSKPARPGLLLLRYTTGAGQTCKAQARASRAGWCMPSTPSRCAAVPPCLGRPGHFTLAPGPHGLVLCDPYQLGQALSGATALTWQLGMIFMDPKKSDSVRVGHPASRSPAPANRSGVLPFTCKIAVPASGGIAPVLHKLSHRKGGTVQVPSSG